ncbi:hypothetical protein B0H67DRAFT_474856 [Lasiosphaeris hirsuta]|uniref:Uncharacterized protein n=1 Tax=Lasiosphaeris hirsuta TaxID=260670 RepID=A0AA40B8M0_9PEZI|nr:hypothetical protein B0H67DRAFT_474856 [Lasiosphaeris hirsuta]
MTEVLLQSALVESKGAQLAEEATQIRQRCAADHGDNNKAALLECAECYEMVLEAVRSRYLNSPDAEWFSGRRAFLQELDTMFADAKEYQLDPRVIDDRIQEERARWYTENVEASLLRFMAEDPARRDAVKEKLEDVPMQMVGLATEITNLLGESPLLAKGAGLDGVPARLSAAKGAAERTEVLRDAFLSTGPTTSSTEGAYQAALTPEDAQRYLSLLQDSSSMEAVIERVLEERAATIASREQIGKLQERLQVLLRGRTGYELQKSRREKQRQAEVMPDELYDLSPCLMCSKVPTTRDFFCCPICTILVAYKAQDTKPTVYCCAEHDSHRDQLRHATSHACASEAECIRPASPAPAHPDDSSTLVFCRECLTSLKLPTLWCSAACAEANFQRHREDVHMPARKRLGLVVTDRDQLDYFPARAGAGAEENGGAAGTRYRAKDIGVHVIPYDSAAKKWEEKMKIKLQRVEEMDWTRDGTS